MLNKLSIGRRLVLLIAVQAVLLFVIGLTSIISSNYASTTTSVLNENIIEEVRINTLNEIVSGDFLHVVNSVHRGAKTWEAGVSELQLVKSRFVQTWDNYLASKSVEEMESIKNSLGKGKEKVLFAMTEIERILSTHNRAHLSLFVLNDINSLIAPLSKDLSRQAEQKKKISAGLFSSSKQTSSILLYFSLVIAVIGIIGSIMLGVVIYHSISNAIARISSTVSKVSHGDFHARTNTSESDELGVLGRAFDSLLEDKVATLVQVEKDSNQLNQSIIYLLQAVSKISQRDLTIKVPVTEDITGPVADALNILTNETSKVLHGVRDISEHVARASAKVKQQTDTVISVANEEQKTVVETARELANAADTMNGIAHLAKICNQAAEDAVLTNQTAMDTVNNTVTGINGIRETIHETEKRIKRLGERSQEIGRAVNLINSISERTHILALNASMHAASAGEAGRGFAVVADEVQRLAENARDATSQISTLVNNIQVETSDTVSTMNNVISQVVEGSRLAERAGEQMRKTRDSTENLVQSVREISQTSAEQSNVATRLQVRAEEIKLSTQKTSRQLEEQTLQTDRLVQYAKQLLDAVQVFKLPELNEDAIDDFSQVPESDSTRMSA